MHRTGLTAAVAVVGGGPSGLTAAIALASAGFDVALVARAAPVDNRTTALLASSVTALETLGVWDHCRAHAEPFGTLRIIDYKIGRAPKQSRSLQLPIYGVMAQQELEGHRGRSWTVAAAGYVAFKEKEPFVPLGGRATALEAAIADGQKRMLAAVDAIERGEFPVQPDEPFRCQWCGYAGVCRKDYVGDE